MRICFGTSVLLFSSSIKRRSSAARKKEDAVGNNVMSPPPSCAVVVSLRRAVAFRMGAARKREPATPFEPACEVPCFVNSLQFHHAISIPRGSNLIPIYTCSCCASLAKSRAPLQPPRPGIGVQRISNIRVNKCGLFFFL